MFIQQDLKDAKTPYEATTSTFSNVWAFSNYFSAFPSFKYFFYTSDADDFFSSNLWVFLHFTRLYSADVGLWQFIVVHKWVLEKAEHLLS